MEDKYDKKLKELDRKIRALKLKKKEDKYKVIKETLYKNDKYFTESDVQKIEEFISNILSKKTDKNNSKSIKKVNKEKLDINEDKELIKTSDKDLEEPDRISSENLEILDKEEIEEAVKVPISSLEIYCLLFLGFYNLLFLLYSHFHSNIYFPQKINYL